MKYASFNYTDLKGKSSARKVLIVGSPSDKFSTIDVSDETDETIGLFASEYDALQSQYIAQVEALKEKYDLKHNFRQFLEVNVDNLHVEQL